MTRKPTPVRRVALVSLGCPKNQVDSELILGRLSATGCEIVDDPDDADALVVNTCAFIDKARAESVEALLDAAAWKAARPGRRVIAAGCLVQRSAAELVAELPELDGLIGLDDIADSAARVLRPGTNRKGALPAFSTLVPTGARAPAPRLPTGPSHAIFDHAAPRVRLGPRHTAFVKIAEGCDQRCSFCAIPAFRGRVRSRPVSDLGAELVQLAREGVVEANLIAQDSTGYGRDLGLRDGLAELVRAVDRLDQAPAWVRIHYLYPGRISAAFLEALANSRRVVEYIDLPLQHAHPAVLRRMNRPGGPDLHLKQLADLGAALPGAGIRSSFIVGFPGETEEEFDALSQFVAEAGFDAVGVFTYSHEDGTTAQTLADDIPAPVKEERRTALEEIAAAVAQERNSARVGRTLEVLVDGPAADDPALAEARWRGQAPEVDGRVLIENASGLRPGDLVRVVVTGAGPHELTARAADAPARPTREGGPV